MARRFIQFDLRSHIFVGRDENVKEYLNWFNIEWKPKLFHFNYGTTFASYCINVKKQFIV